MHSALITLIVDVKKDEKAPFVFFLHIGMQALLLHTFDCFFHLLGMMRTAQILQHLNTSFFYHQQQH